ncbi:unnamed protein product [Heligmosomoides polygyrus]|uniref:NR LBD domain-containing protein n=1 Tax=Heligmosomoides polygyrus TaxID=6339 RepID=A0A183G827_HELPZ|nr:unnamed protein product [Heligmosomoides polygyrus]
MSEHYQQSAKRARTQRDHGRGRGATPRPARGRRSGWTRPVWRPSPDREFHLSHATTAPTGDPVPTSVNTEPSPAPVPPASPKQVDPAPPQLQGSWAEHMEFEERQYSVVKTKTPRGARPSKPSTTTSAVTSSEPHDQSSRPTQGERRAPLREQALQSAGPPQVVTPAQQGPPLQERTPEGLAVDHRSQYEQLLALITGSGQVEMQGPSTSARTTAPTSVPISSTTLFDPRTTDQLTDRQFRTVFDYIHTSNILRAQIEALEVPPRKVTPARSEDYERAAQIVHLIKTLQRLAAATTSSFHNLATMLGRSNPLQFRYGVLMGWIHELTHSISSIDANIHQLYELTVPRFLDWSNDQNYFRSTLQLFHITPESLTETIQFASTVSAHAIRMMRVVEAHQLLLVLHHRVGNVTEADREYASTTRPDMPEAP